MDVQRRVGINLQRLRHEKGLSQEELAHSANVHQTYLSGVENVLGRLQTATDAANILRREALTSVLVGIFNSMGAGYMQRQLEFSSMPDTRYSLTPFLGRFQAIYTTNQDTLIEQKYLPVSSHQRRAHLPGLKYIDPSALTGSAHDAIAVMEPNPAEFRLSPMMQPYIKLHGSVNWVESNVGERILIMGGQKTAIIKKFPLLNWYHEEFRKTLALPGARLMVMGYSFSDEHINDAILAAVKTSDLKIFIVDPGGVGIIDKRDKSAAI
jgi:transcriptional regulator with XRE-family HTH domain